MCQEITTPGVEYLVWNTTPSNAYYTLSLLTKGLWINCNKCGNHASGYIPDLKIPWKPSKTFIKKVGKQEAIEIAKELEKTGKLKSRTDLEIPALQEQKNKTREEKKKQTQYKPAVKPASKIYCDAGTKNNGKKGFQETIVVVCDEKSNILMEKWIGDYSNNEGEILGIIACLRDHSKGKPIEVRTDSNVAANWTIKGWTKYHEKQLKKSKLTSRHKKFIELAHKLLLNTNSTITWMSRNENLAGIYIENKHSI